MSKNLVVSPATKALLGAGDEGGSQAEMGHITQRLLDLEHEIRLLKSHYNSKIPMCRLPPEVLCKIFVYVTCVEAQHRKVRSRFGVGQVCRHWRGIALDFTELWTDLSFDNPTAVIEAMIARSRGAPISIHYCQGTASSMDLLCNIVGDADCLCAAKLEYSQTELTEILTKFASVATVLEELVMLASRGDLRPNAPVLRPGFLEGGARSLKRLELRTPSCVSCNSIPFRVGITHLTLTCLPLNPTRQLGSMSRPTLCSFVRYLGSMLNLQKIALGGYLPADSLTASMAVGSDIPLFQALKLLSLHDSIDLISASLHFLRIAPTTELEFTFAAEIVEAG